MLFYGFCPKGGGGGCFSYTEYVCKIVFVFWIFMGCGVASFGRRGKNHLNLHFLSQKLSAGVSRGD